MDVTDLFCLPTVTEYLSYIIAVTWWPELVVALDALDRQNQHTGEVISARNT